MFDDDMASPVAVKMRSIKLSLSRTPNLGRVVYVSQNGGSTNFGTFMICSRLAFASLLSFLALRPNPTLLICAPHSPGVVPVRLASCPHPRPPLEF